MAYTIVTPRRPARTRNYNGLNAGDVAVTNIDNDTAGHHGHAHQRPDDDRSGRHRDLHRRAHSSADGRRDDRPVSSATRPKARCCAGSLTFTAANWNTPKP